jgi:uncharacterized coiled-coil protein SlyX
MVASLLERVSAGEQQLQEANRRLAEQEASSKVLAEQVETLRKELKPVAVVEEPPAVVEPLAAVEEPVAAVSAMPSAMAIDEEAADLAPVSSDTDILVDPPGALTDAPAVTASNIKEGASGEAEGDVAAPSTGAEGEGEGEGVAPNIGEEGESLVANSGEGGDCVVAIAEPQVESASIASTAHE